MTEAEPRPISPATPRISRSRLVWNAFGAPLAVLVALLLVSNWVPWIGSYLALAAIVLTVVWGVVRTRQLFAAARQNASP
ncbi:MAG: hypothetical protein ACKVVT_18505 [Dehalococcoidia bacterium]